MTLLKVGKGLAPPFPLRSHHMQDGVWQGDSDTHSHLCAHLLEGERTRQAWREPLLGPCPVARQLMGTGDCPGATSVLPALPSLPRPNPSRRAPTRSKAAPARADTHHPCPPCPACFLQFKATLASVWDDLGSREPIAQTPGSVRKFPKT